MSKFNLDLKKFKHVKSDDKSTTLQHSDGHLITIAHKPLSKELLKQVSDLKMADGGKIDRVDPDKAAAAQKGAQQSEDLSQGWQNIKSGVGELFKADGGTVEDDDVGYLGSRKPLVKADPRQPAPSQTVTHKKSPEQIRSEQDDYSKTQDASRSAWDPDYKAKGGRVAMAEGGPMPGAPQLPNGESAYDANLPCLNPNCKSHGTPHPNCQCYPHMAEGGAVSKLRYCAHGQPHKEGCEYAHGGKVEDNTSMQGKDVRYAQREKRRGDHEMAEHSMQTAKSEAKGRMEFERSVKPNLKGLADGGEPEAAPEIEDRSMHRAYFTPEAEPSVDEQNKGLDKEIEDASNFVEKPEAQPAPGLAAEAPAPEALAQAPQDPAQPAEQANPQADMAAQQPQDQSAVQDQSSNPIARFAQHRDMTQQALVNEDAAWANDLQNGHIKPETYQSLFADKKTLGKIGTLFGLLVSGAGSGLSHQPNAVMEMMKNTIDNDLKAQQNSKLNAENYLRLGQQHMVSQAQAGNLNADAEVKNWATTSTKMNWAAFQQMVDNVNKMPPGPAKQQAMQQLAYMHDTIKQGNFDILSKASTASAYMNTLGVGGQGGAAPGPQGSNSGQGGQSEEAFQRQQRNRMLMGPDGEKMANMAIERHIPGVAGQASIPIPGETKQKIQDMQILDNKVRDVLDFAKKNKGSINPAVIKQARQKAEELTSFYNKSVDSLGLSKGRLGWLEEQIKKNPTSLIEQMLGNNATLKEIRDSNANRKNLILSGPGGLGFPKQPEYKVDSSGQKWMRGPKGEAIKVK